MSSYCHGGILACMVFGRTLGRNDAEFESFLEKTKTLTKWMNPKKLYFVYPCLRFIPGIGQTTRLFYETFSDV